MLAVVVTGVFVGLGIMEGRRIEVGMLNVADGGTVCCAVDVYVGSVVGFVAV